MLPPTLSPTIASREAWITTGSGSLLPSGRGMRTLRRAFGPTGPWIVIGCSLHVRRVRGLSSRDGFQRRGPQLRDAELSHARLERGPLESEQRGGAPGT